MYGFDISGFGGKVVSVTVLTMRMTQFLFNSRQIWREFGQQFCANPPISFGLFFDRPQGGLQMDLGVDPPPPLRGSLGVQSGGNFSRQSPLTGPQIANSAGSLGSKP